MKQIMKGIIKLAIALEVLMLMVSSAGAVPTAMDFGVNDTSGNPDTFVKVPVNITDVHNDSIASIRLEISYDPKVINLTRDQVIKGDLTSEWESPSFNPAKGKISIVIETNTTTIPTGASGSVVILNFSVVGAPGAKSAMNISGIELSDLQGAVGTAPARNGTFTIKGQPSRGIISGMKFNDSNGNGTKDSGESGLANWTIVLKNGTGSIVKTNITDLNGNYTFEDLAQGNYTVEEVLQANWTQTYPKAPGIHTVTLAAGEIVTKRDFGNGMNVTPEPAGIPVITNFTPPTSQVIDVIGDPSRTFTIHVDQVINVSWKINGNEVSSQTNVNTSSYSNTPEANGTWNVSALVNNANGSDMQTWIWDVRQPITGKGSISGMKFNDSNGNAGKDPEESGLSNWTIVLKDSTGSKVGARMTDNNGKYVFGELAAGNYTVEEVLRANWTQTFPEAPGIYNVTIATMENVTGIDFGNNLRSWMPSGVNAIREIEKKSLRKGESTNITVRINSDIIQALALKESLPAGWNLTRISDNADGFKSRTNEWAWSNVSPGITTTVIYSITAPIDGSIGTYYINGTISNSTGLIAIVDGNNMINLDIFAYYRRLGNDPDLLETTDLLKAMDDWRNGANPIGFAIPINSYELYDLINEWIMS
jgi:hypothetical protein